MTPVFADPQPQTSLAMYGTAKEPADFTHFSYANPDAPKSGTLKLGFTGTFDSLNPFTIMGDKPVGVATGFRSLSLVYEPLMARSSDEPFTLYPLIAQSVEVADDRSSIIFNLDPAAHFSDGSTITADDILFSFKTFRDKGSPNLRRYYRKAASAEKLDTYRVRYTFKPEENGRVDREMPLIMALMPVLPQHEWEGRDITKTSLRVPVGSGPYKVTNVDAGRSITYTRDPNYWGRGLPAARGLYNFDTIRIDYYRDDNSSLQAFRSGQYDYRLENDPNKWSTGYDFPAAHDGRVKIEEFPHHRTEIAYGFVLNKRRPVFSDPALRAALEYTFDSGWINRNLFHGLYRRTGSYFPNSELAAPPLPDGRELEILNTFRERLPPEIFSQPVTPPDTDGTEESLRANLLKANDILHNAGYALREGRLYAPHGSEPISFEILLDDPSEDKLALAWTRTLKRLGIEAHIHTLHSSEYQTRLSTFDYDVTTARWTNSLSPGNEQSNYWSSTAADQPGSRNYPGTKDPVVDALTAAIPQSQSRDDLIAHVHALDRVLMVGHYMIPFFYLGRDDVATWAKLRHPDALPLYGMVQESWWAE